MRVAEIVEACAVAAEAQDRVGREWVRDSLWDQVLKRAGANVRTAGAAIVARLGPSVYIASGREAQLAAALEKIAGGDGYYGSQAREYKNIARAALGQAMLS